MNRVLEHFQVEYEGLKQKDLIDLFKITTVFPRK